ncbi:WAT1-related protein [Parasponia andersonii]|uniref:WAT1-related protein n=1 Tax=Parasponia andersonii TaxID=3476 RepID=A0A2P5DF63_PARAD|nr:WAT1-related protein [Parasponia andersonii]
MFNPLTLILVALSEALILDEAIRIGTLLGTVLIILGLYSFLWGKTKEIKSLPRQRVEAEEPGNTIDGEPTALAQPTAMVPSTSPVRKQ